VLEELGRSTSPSGVIGDQILKVMASSKFVPGSAVLLEEQPGMRVISAVLASQEPLSLLQIADLAELKNWQQVELLPIYFEAEFFVI
jgi:hypothetical protein